MRHDVHAHHVVEGDLDAYLERAGIAVPDAPLFQSVRQGTATGRRLRRSDVLAMVKQRATAAGLAPATCCHAFRATGITAYLQNSGTLEHAQKIAAHASPKTTKLYDRTSDAIALDESSGSCCSEAPPAGHDAQGRGAGDRPSTLYSARRIGVNWLAGFDFEIKVIARMPS